MTVEDSTEATQLPPRRALHLLLPDHHRRIEAMCKSMLAWAYTDNARELTARWAELEEELYDHMASEEEVILPEYQVHAPVDAKLVLDDHIRIRALVAPIGVAVELHEVRAAQLRHLVDVLDAHAIHEDTAMYPWAERNLPLVAQRLLFARIGRWFIRS